MNIRSAIEEVLYYAGDATLLPCVPVQLEHALSALRTWLDAQPAAEERWEPVDGRVDCACCSLNCGEYAATADYRGIWYLRVEDQEGHAEITLPDDVRLCRRVEVTP